MYKESYDINEYLVIGTQTGGSFDAYVASGLQVRGMFTTMYRYNFETSMPKGLPLPEQIVEDAEIKGVTSLSFRTADGKKRAFKVKKLEDANWPYGYGDMDFGERFR